MLPEICIHHLTNRNGNEWFTCAAVHDRQGIVCGTDQGVVYQAQPPSSENKSTYIELIGHTKLVSDICYYDPAGSYLLTCSADHDIRLWRSSSPQCITIYRAHLSPVWCLTVDEKTDRFASGSMDRTVRVWTPDRHDVLRTFVFHSDDVNTLSFHPNGKYLASGSTDGQIVLWSIEQAQPARILKSAASIEQLTFAADGNQLVAISHDPEQQSDRVSVWDIRSASETLLVQNIPSQRLLLRAHQMPTTTRFLTGFDKSLLFFDIGCQREEEARLFCSPISTEPTRRLIHVSSNEPNKAVVIVE